MIWLEDSFGLPHVWCVRYLGCPFVFYTTFGRDWDLMSQMCIYILLFIYICDDMNICYLLSATLHMLRTGFVFGLEIIHWACGCSTPPLFLFPPGVIAIGGMQTCITLCDSFRSCICTLELMSANVKLCNSYVSLNVILIKDEAMYCIHLSRSVRPCEPTIC